MLKVPKVKDSVIQMLTEDGWTPERLAKAEAGDLTGYAGVGDVTAWRIIVAARRQVRATGAPVDRSKLVAISPAPVVYDPTPPPSPPPPPAVMSERVRRIYER